MNPSTKDEIEGTVHEVKGKIKETAGKVTNNPNLQAEGNACDPAGLASFLPPTSNVGNGLSFLQSLQFRTNSSMT